jgi:MFS family permease
MARVFGADHRVLILAIARMGEAAASGFILIALPLYIASEVVSGFSFGLDTALISGIIISGGLLLTIVPQPIAGYLSDTVGRRKPFAVVSLAVRSVTAFLFTLATAYPLVLLFQFITSVASAVFTPAAMALITEYSDPETRAVNFGAYTSLRLVGAVAGPLAAGGLIADGPYEVAVLGSVTGFEAAFYIAALGILVSLVLTQLFVYDPPETTATAREDISVNIFADEPDRTFDPVFVLALATVLFGGTTYLITAIQPEINTRLNQTAATFSLQFVAPIAILALLGPVVGKFADRYGRRPFLVVSGLFVVPGVLLQGFATSSMMLLAGSVVIGIGMALAFAPAVALVGDLSDGAGAGTQLSLLTMSLYLGQAIGPLVAGFFVTFWFPLPFLIGAGMGVLAVVLIYFQVPETFGTDSEQVEEPTPAPTD